MPAILFTSQKGFHVYLRHESEMLWYARGQRWLSERSESIRFRSLCDAILYAQVLGISGRALVFDQAGKQILDFDVADLVHEIVRNGRMAPVV